MTEPFNIITVSLFTGEIMRSFTPTNELESPLDLESERLLFGTGEYLYFGFTGKTDYDWKIYKMTVTGPSRSAIQERYSMGNQDSSSRTKNKLFGGCVPEFDNQNELYFSGYYKDETTQISYVRVGSINLGNSRLHRAYDGKSDNFKTALGVEGFFQCVKADSDGQEKIIVAAQNRQDLTGIGKYSSLNFWLGIIDLPLSAVGYTLSEYKIYASTSQAITQITGVSYNEFDDVPMFIL
mmetsp:Transcript_43904/g.42430  ORF Transcript_43904/g.42430 Transcript_43904/m.42430 type:complete len:238 (-) Transcript_43904:757-1470(-)